MTVVASAEVSADLAQTLADLVCGLRVEDLTQKVTLALTTNQEIGLTGEMLYLGAVSVARELSAHGLSRGDCVLIVADFSVLFIVGFLGIQLAGMVAVPVPCSVDGARGSATAKRARAIHAASQPRAVIGTNDQVREVLGEVPQKSVLISSFDLTSQSGHREFERTEVAPDDVAVIQFTSGSTSDPRGCVLTHEAVIANLVAMKRAFGLRHEDTGVGWLPMHHDMGLFGQLCLPLFVQGMRTTLLPTRRFLRSPVSWFELLSTTRATITPAPPSILPLMSRLAERWPRGKFDLSGLRNLVVGAEPIDLSLVRSFLTAMRPQGLDESAVAPSYGLSQATLFVCAGKGLRAHSLPSSNSPIGSASLPHVGHGLPAIGDICIGGANGKDATVGEILIRGASLMRGYWEDNHLRPIILRDGWFETGDIGYIVDGDLVILGRATDQMNLAGVKWDPADLELAIERELGISSVVFDEWDPPSGSYGLVVVVEVKASLEQNQLARSLRSISVGTVGTHPSRIVFIGRGDLPRTSSGKVQRRETRKMVAELVGAQVPTSGR